MRHFYIFQEVIHLQKTRMTGETLLLFIRNADWVFKKSDPIHVVKSPKHADLLKT